MKNFHHVFEWRSFGRQSYVWGSIRNIGSDWPGAV